MKDKIIKWSSKNDVSLFCVAITAVVTVIEFVVLHFDHTYVFPFTLLAFAVMVVKIGLHIFGKSQKRTFLYLSCGIANIVMINRLFHYEKLIEIFPLLKGINQWMVLLASASIAIVIILLVRFIIWLINKPNYEHEKTVTRKAINKSAVKDWRDIRIINVAAFSFAIISWFATAQGLEEYVFDSIWQAALVSFGIQGILFVFNLKLPRRFYNLVKITTDGGRKSRWFLKSIFVVFYVIVLVSSSFFSFVYICDTVVYQHQSGYTDDNAMLSALYSRHLQQTEDYIEEETKALQILASVQLSDLLAENPQILGNQIATRFRTDEVIDDEIAQKESELAMKEQEERIAHESYKNEQKNYEALYGERFWRSDEFEVIKKNIDKKLIEWKNAQDGILILKTDINKLKREKASLSNSPTKKSAEFLTMFLEVDPSPSKLQNCINELQSMVIDMQDGYIIPPNLGQIVTKIRALSITIEDYSILRGNDGNSTAKAALDSLKDTYAKEIMIPDPRSETFEAEKESWRTDWISRYERLQALIRSLPRYHESEAAQSLSGDHVDINVLKEYDPDKMEDEINAMVREKLSDINAVEEGLVPRKNLCSGYATIVCHITA